MIFIKYFLALLLLKNFLNLNRNLDPICFGTVLPGSAIGFLIKQRVFLLYPSLIEKHHYLDFFY